MEEWAMRRGNEIMSRDIERARRFLRETFENEVERGRSTVPAHFASLVADHSERVGEIASWIADAEGLPVNQLRLAGILHDVKKLAANIPGGIVSPVIHADRGKVEAVHFLTEDLHKSDELSIAISCMINAHSATPLSKDALNLETPDTPEEWALRDANMLDYLDFWGMAMEVGFRQHPGTFGYKRDKGNIVESIGFARSMRIKYSKGLHGETAKKIGMILRRRGSRFVLFMSGKTISNIEDFRAVLNEFIATEFIYTPPS